MPKKRSKMGDDLKRRITCREIGQELDHRIGRVDIRTYSLLSHIPVGIWENLKNLEILEEGEMETSHLK